MTGWRVLPERIDIDCGDVHVVVCSRSTPSHLAANGAWNRTNGCTHSQTEVSGWRRGALSGVLGRMHYLGSELTQGFPGPVHPGALRTALPAFAVTGGAHHFIIGVSTGARIEISTQAVPRWVDETTRATLTRSESRLVDQVPPGSQEEALARIWTRKDAALRLTGDCVRGAMRGAATVLTGSRWSVIVPAADGNTCRTVDVYDLPRCDGSVSALATDSPPANIFTWLWPE